MVERQYDTMKRDRMRQLDEPNNMAAKPSVRPEENEIPAAPQPTNTASSATEAQPSEQEVCAKLFNFHIHTYYYDYHNDYFNKI